MPVAKEKVIAALNLKTKGKNVSQKLKDSYATRYADKIATDEEIDAFIDDRLDDIVDAQKEADRRASEASTKAKQEAADAIAGKKPNEPAGEQQDDLPADTPAWAKTLIEQNKKLTGRVDAMDAAKTHESIAERFKKDERLKNVPEFMFKGRIPIKDEDYETAVTELATDFKPHAERFAFSGQQSDKPRGGASSGGGEGKVDPAITAFAKQQTDSFKEQNKN